nr:50S ribosomal protein L35, chloroplastic [Ipomoea batatas]
MTMAMVSSSPSALHCSLAFNFSSRTPSLSASRLSITPSLSTKKPALNLSSSHSISTSAPLVLSRVPSPAQKAPQPFTVVCAKGYKMKTHKGFFEFAGVREAVSGVREWEDNEEESREAAFA